MVEGLDCAYQTSVVIAGDRRWHEQYACMRAPLHLKACRQLLEVTPIPCDQHTLLLGRKLQLLLIRRPFAPVLLRRDHIEPARVPSRRP